MTKERYVSPFKNYMVAKKGRLFMANFLDYLFVFAGSLLICFSICSPIYKSLPSSQSLATSLTDSQLTCSKVVASTHLQNYDESTSSLVSTSSMGEKYVVNLAKTSYYLRNEDYPLTYNTDTKTWTLQKLTIADTLLKDNYGSDNMSYYFLSFKSQNKELDSYVYDGVDYSSNPESFLYTKAFGYDDSASSYFSVINTSVSSYLQLTSEASRSVVDYYVYSDSGTNASSIVESLLTYYGKASSFFIDEVTSKYTPYLEALSNYTSIYNQYVSLYLLSLVLGFVLSFLILELLIPSLDKSHRSLAYRSFNLALSSVDELEPRFWQYLVRTVMRFMIDFSSFFLVLSFSNEIGLAFLSFGFFSYSYLLLASLVLGLTSIVITIISHSGQGLSEYLSRLSIRDLNYMEKGVAKEDGSVK